MKKLFFMFITALTVMMTACSNDAIVVETKEPIVKDALVLTVSLNNFFSSYSYRDTKHNIEQIADKYRTFYSEYKKYIQVRTLFYNRDSGVLVDSVLTYTINTNDVIKKVSLPNGNYYAITTITFADKNTGNNASWWYLVDKESLETVRLRIRRNDSPWSIMSYSSETFTIQNDNHVTLSTTPSPIGTLTYIYYQNFQYKDEASYGTIYDNGIRRLALYTQNLATEFMLNPQASSKYNYRADGGKKTWFYLSKSDPTDFDESWTYFRSNLYSYCYVLAPEFNFCFGYTLEGSSTFQAYGQSKYSITPGVVYLAYWDHFQIGNPYFGKADNNHWHDYSAETKAELTPLFSEKFQ